MPRSTSLRRQPRGFTLLVAIGVVALVTMAVMLSYSVVGREADSQADSRRKKEAFFAAEAGLAEGREAMRLRAAANNGYNGALQALVPSRVAEDGMSDNGRPWFELLPGSADDGWNYLSLTPDTMDPTELADREGEAYDDYPTQNNVRYRVFVRDDIDGNDGDEDDNGQVWVIAIGEVVNPSGRPTRAVVQALIASQSALSVVDVGSTEAGGGQDKSYDYP